jgi:hypothetical protein
LIRHCETLLAVLGLVAANLAGAAEPPLTPAERRVEDAGTVLKYALPATALALTFLMTPSSASAATAQDSTPRRRNLLRMGGTPRHDLALAVGRTWIVTEGLKQTVDETRPRGGARSFPSGHTSIAFTGAEFMRKQYGWKIAAPAYLAAGFVGWSRVEVRAHFTRDVLAGALIGILANHDLPERHGDGGAWRVAPALLSDGQRLIPGVALTWNR